MNEWGKIELLRQYECWTDKTSKLYKRGVKKKNITIRVSFLSRASLNLCPGLLQSLQPDKSDKMEDRSNTSWRAKSTLSMLNFSLRLPNVWLVCMYAFVLFCLAQKKNYVLLLEISLCPEKPYFHIFMYFVFWSPTQFISSIRMWMLNLKFKL